MYSGVRYNYVLWYKYANMAQEESGLEMARQRQEGSNCGHHFVLSAVLDLSKLM